MKNKLAFKGTPKIRKRRLSEILSHGPSIFLQEGSARSYPAFFVTPPTRKSNGILTPIPFYEDKLYKVSSYNKRSRINFGDKFLYDPKRDFVGLTGDTWSLGFWRGRKESILTIKPPRSVSTREQTFYIEIPPKRFEDGFPPSIFDYLAAYSEARQS